MLGDTELVVQYRRVERRTVLKGGDGRDVGETLGRRHVVLIRCAGLRAEQVEPADRTFAKAHQRTVHGVKALRSGGELGPTVLDAGERMVDVAVPEAKQSIDGPSFDGVWNGARIRIASLEVSTK